MVMYDRETDSFWSQFLGEAIDGPKKGAKLEFILAQMVTWGSWKEEHPDTLCSSILGALTGNTTTTKGTMETQI